MKLFRTRRQTKDWSVGIFIAAVLLVLWYKWQGELQWWALVGTILISIILDVLLTGSSTEEVVGIEE